MSEDLKAMAHRAANILHAAENGGTAGTPAKVRGVLRELIEKIEGETRIELLPLPALPATVDQARARYENPAPFAGEGVAIHNRYPVGYLTAVADMQTQDDIPVMIVGHLYDSNVLVQFRANDPIRDILAGDIIPVSTIQLTKG